MLTNDADDQFLFRIIDTYDERVVHNIYLTRIISAESLQLLERSELTEVGKELTVVEYRIFDEVLRFFSNVDRSLQRDYRSYASGYAIIRDG